MDDLKPKMTEALRKIGNVLEDFSSLEVQTLSGSLNVKVTDGKLDDFETLLKNAETDGTLKLRAVTKMMFDGDAINLVPDGDFSGDIEKMHSAAVKAGIDTRHGLLALFGGMVGLKPGK